MAATSGVHASWAAAGTAIASASHRGSHRASASRQAGREQQDPAGGQRRQREARRDGQPGVEQHQHEDRRPEAAQRPVPAVGPQRDQPDRAHHRRPQHARLGAGEQHEADDARAPATRCSHRPRTRHHRASASRKPDDQGQVGAGHRQQVGQPGRPEGLLQRRVDRGVVAVHQGRHQRALVGRPVRHRVAERLPHRRGRRATTAPAPATSSGVAARPEQARPGRGRRPAPAGPCSRTVAPSGTVASRASPSTRTGAASSDGAAAPRDLAGAEPPHHLVAGQRRSRAGDRARVGGDRADHGDRRALGRPARRPGCAPPARPGAPPPPPAATRDEQQPGHGAATADPAPPRPSRRRPRPRRRRRAPTTRARTARQAARPRRPPRPRRRAAASAGRPEAPGGCSAAPSLTPSRRARACRG